MKPILQRQTIGEILELTQRPDGRIDLAEVKRNYKRLIKVYHPDMNKSPEAAEYAKRLNQAYAIATGKESPPQQPIQPPPQHPHIIIRYYNGSTSTSATGTWYW